VAKIIQEAELHS